MVTVKPMNQLALHYICTHLRDVDAREIYPLCNFSDPENLTTTVLYMLDFGEGGIVWCDGMPVAAFGVHRDLMCSSVFRVFAFGTDKWKSAVFVVMRELRKLVRKYIRLLGTVRMHCDSHIDHKEAHAWMERMGGRPEGEPMRLYGKNGETYIRYVWLRDEQQWLDDPKWKEYAT